MDRPNPGSPLGGGGFLSSPGSSRPTVRRLGWRWFQLPPTRFGQAVLCTALLVALLISLAFLIGVGAELPYRAGWSGTAGTLSSISCDTDNSGNSTFVDCSGQFTPASGGAQVTATVEGSNPLDTDASYPVRLHSDGETASVVSARTVVYVLAALAICLLGVVVSGGLLVIGIFGLARSRPGLVWGPSRFIALLVLVTAAVLGLLAIVGNIVAARLGI